MLCCTRPRREEQESWCSCSTALKGWYLGAEFFERLADVMGTLWGRSPVAAVGVSAIVGTAEVINTLNFQLPHWGLTAGERGEREQAADAAADGRRPNPCGYYTLSTLSTLLMMFNSGIEIIFLYEALKRWSDEFLNGPPEPSIDPATNFLPVIEGYEWGVIALYFAFVRWPFDGATMGAEIIRNTARIFPPGVEVTLPAWLQVTLNALGSNSLTRFWFVRIGAFSHNTEHMLNMLLLVPPVWLSELDIEEPRVITALAVAGLLFSWGALTSLGQTCLFDGNEADEEWRAAGGVEPATSRRWIQPGYACCFRNSMRLWGPAIHGLDVAADIFVVALMFTGNYEFAYSLAAVLGLGAGIGFWNTELNTALEGVAELTVAGEGSIGAAAASARRYDGPASGETINPLPDDAEMAVSFRSGSAETEGGHAGADEKESPGWCCIC